MTRANPVFRLLFSTKATIPLILAYLAIGFTVMRLADPDASPFLSAFTLLMFLPIIGIMRALMPFCEGFKGGDHRPQTRAQQRCERIGNVKAAAFIGFFTLFPLVFTLATANGSFGLTNVAPAVTWIFITYFLGWNRVRFVALTIFGVGNEDIPPDSMKRMERFFQGWLIQVHGQSEGEWRCNFSVSYPKGTPVPEGYARSFSTGETFNLTSTEAWALGAALSGDGNLYRLGSAFFCDTSANLDNMTGHESIEVVHSFAESLDLFETMRITA